MLDGREERIKYIENIDTLSKCQKDAEEDRKQRNIENLNASGLRKRNFSKFIRSEVDKSIGGSVSLKEQERNISIEKYLTYNNPIVKSATVENFVSNALFTGRISSLIPSSSVCRKLFEENSKSIVLGVATTSKLLVL
ncbi:MAG TPA: hypothetical protein VKR32_01270 [Puia sp.]|nr:hypothetical protein [Puia sp.]